jgi:hypothetical protein
MIKRTAQLLLLLLLPLSTLSATAVDSARDLLAAGRIDEVITTLNDHVSPATSDAESANLLCRAYLAIDDLNRAETSCKKAIALDPENSRYHRWMGHVYGAKAGRANFLSAAGLARNLSAPSNSTRVTSRPAAISPSFILRHPASLAAARTRPELKPRFLPRQHLHASIGSTLTLLRKTETLQRRSVNTAS